MDWLGWTPDLDIACPVSIWAFCKTFGVSALLSWFKSKMDEEHTGLSSCQEASPCWATVTPSPRAGWWNIKRDETLTRCQLLFRHNTAVSCMTDQCAQLDIPIGNIKDNCEQDLGLEGGWRKGSWHSFLFSSKLCKVVNHPGNLRRETRFMLGLE